MSDDRISDEGMIAPHYRPGDLDPPVTARHDKATPFNGTRDPRDIRTYYTSEVAYLRSIQRQYACPNCATATGMCSSCKRLDARIKELEA